MSGGDEAQVKIGRRVFVSNLAWRTSWQDLKDKFRECGTVVYSNVIRGDDGRSKGWGIVEYENQEEAIAAMQTLNGVELGGRNIIVREDREDRDVKGPSQPSRPRRRRNNNSTVADGAEEVATPADAKTESSGCQVVVHGLPWSYTWRELRPMFEGFGTIERADVAYGRDGRSRGYGTVRFNSPEEAQAAIQALNGTDLEGRSLSVKIDQFA